MTRYRHAAIGILVLGCLAGCSSQEERQTYSQEISHLRWLLRLNSQATAQGKTPQSEADFKAYINSLDAETRDRLMTGTGASSIDELFVSERDGQPYVIFYGRPPAGVSNDVFGYEQVGVDGKRYVGYRLGMVAEVDEQQFDELVPTSARPKQ